MSNPFRCVMDANVCIQYFIPAPLSSKVDKLLAHLANPQTDIYVPDLFYIEMANILWKYFRARQITDSKIRTDLAMLKAFELKVISMTELMEEAADIAIEYEITAYDASYVALSRRVNAPLLTLDKKLFRSMETTIFDIRLFTDFTISS